MFSTHRIAAATLVLGLAGLGFAAHGPARAEEPAPSARPEDLKKRVATIDNHMGLKLMAELRKAQGDKNIFISPLSIAIALHMTYNGAQGDTATEMAEALQFPGVNINTINNGNKELRASLTANDKLTLKVANAIFSSKDYKFSADFLKRVNESFGAKIESLNFSDPATVEHINKWCSDNTNGKITKIIADLSPDDRMILANAVYFKANWKTKFDKAKTREMDFSVTADKSVKVQMMNMSTDVQGFMGEGFMAGKLPYEDGRTSMMLFIPDEVGGMAAMLEKFTPKNWALWQAEFSNQRDARISIPRFKVEYENSLVDALKGMGLKKAFTGDADLSGLSADGKKGLFIADVLHKTYIEVDEEGTEAAAVTAVKVAETAAPRRHYQLVADKPFVYSIVDDTTGAILFIGVMNNPAAK